MKLKKEILTALGVRSDRADRFLRPLNDELPAAHIDTPLRVAHFLAQVLHESGKLTCVEENLNYSAEALLRVFPSYFTPAQASEYARKPPLIGSRVYANRMGNGDEASGDGYRYRGRGLIQLTGKNNYRAFSQRIGADVVAHPELVADTYALHSALYYWTENHINALADLDDVRAVTRRVNGGLNGLSDRMALLDQAKKLLVVEPSALSPEEITHTVEATQLNLRSAPRVSAATWLATLGQGTPVADLGDTTVDGWSHVRVAVNNRLIEGFVASRYLKAVSPAAIEEITPPPVPTLPAAHMQERRRDITRKRDGGRAYPLGETRMPRRRGSRIDTLVRNLLRITAYLDCEKTAHQRYQPQGGTTYCNIYAYDYCYLAGVYLPRVWWTALALQALREGNEVKVRYGDTVREINANGLYNWLEDFGPSFDWQRVLTLDELQAAANNGAVCMIVAQHRDLNRSGHIAAVLPEHKNISAERNTTGEVTQPVQSQAGRRNFRASTTAGRWWTGSQFRAFGFWRHG